TCGLSARRRLLQTRRPPARKVSPIAPRRLVPARSAGPVGVARRNAGLAPRTARGLGADRRGDLGMGLVPRWLAGAVRVLAREALTLPLDPCAVRMRFRKQEGVATTRPIADRQFVAEGRAVG